MYESSVELNLPDTFFAALDKVVDAVQDGFNGSSEDKRTELYHNSLLNYTETQTFVPKFEERQRNDYIKIGRSLMEGMSDIFFERFEKYNDDKDYYKEKESLLPKQLVPVVNVNVNEGKEQAEAEDKADISKLFSSIPLTILLAGIAAGTSAYGQLIESFSLLPKLIGSSTGFVNTIKKSFDSAGSTIGKVSTLGKTIQNAFNILATKVSKIAIIGNSASKMVTKVGGAIGNIGSILAGKVGQIAAKIGSKLKFLPLIGSALGFYQTYLRLSRGEIFLGLLEFAAAVSSLLPGPGTAIAIGINAIQTIIESGSSGVGGVAGLVVKKIAGAGATLLPKLIGSLSTLVAKPLSLILKKIPFIGPIISFGMAVSDFINGSTLSGVLNVLAGLAGLVDFVAPGVGTAIAIAIDALNFFLTATDTGKEFTNSVGDFFSNIGSSISNFFTGIFGWIADAGKAVANFIGDFFSNIGSSISNFFTGIFGWIADAGKAVANSINLIWDSICSFASNIISSIIDQIGIIWDSVGGFVSNIASSIFTYIKNKFKSVTVVLLSMISFGKDIFAKITNILPSFDIKTITNMMASAVDSICSFFNNIASFIWEKITNFFANIKNNLLTGITSAIIPVSAIFNLFDILPLGSIGETISNFIGDIGSNIVNFFSTVINNIKEWITDAIGKIGNFFSSTINDIKEWITGTIGKIGDFFANCYDIVAKSLSGALNSLTAIFDFSGIDNIIDSVLTGIKEAFIKIWNEVKNFFKNAWSGIKDKATALIDGFIEKTKSFGKNIIGFFTDDNDENEEIVTKLPKQQDARITNKPEEPAKIDSTLADNQLTSDRHIRNIASDLARSDNAASLGLNKLCGITEVILSELIKKPSGLGSITTNNIISNGGNISRTTTTKAADPRTLYSN